MWIPCEIEDVKETYKFESHSTKMIKRIPWPVCQHCGLVFLKNKISRWCVKTGCNHSLHRDYKKQFKLRKYNV